MQEYKDQKLYYGWAVSSFQAKVHEAHVLVQGWGVSVSQTAPGWLVLFLPVCCVATSVAGRCGE